MEVRPATGMMMHKTFSKELYRASGTGFTGNSDNTDSSSNQFKKNDHKGVLKTWKGEKGTPVKCLEGVTEQATQQPVKKTVKVEQT